MAVPGTVLGIAMLRGYITGIFNSGVLVLVGTSAILIIAFTVRSLAHRHQVGGGRAESDRQIH